MFMLKGFLCISKAWHVRIGRISLEIAVCKLCAEQLIDDGSSRLMHVQSVEQSTDTCSES